MNTRWLGILTIATAPSLLCIGLSSGFQPEPPNRFEAAVGFLFVVGWAAAILGFRRLRATGTGISAAVLFAVQMVGVTLAGLQQVLEFVSGATVSGAVYGLCDLAWPVGMLLMLGLASVIAATRRLRGWDRWLPFVAGASLPVLFAGKAAGGWNTGAVAFDLTTCVGWVLLGFVLVRGRQRDVALRPDSQPVETVGS